VASTPEHVEIERLDCVAGEMDVLHLAVELAFRMSTHACTLTTARLPFTVPADITPYGIIGWHGMEKTKGSDRLLTTKEAAEYLGLSVSHLNKLRHYGRGPLYRKLGDRPGSAVRYRQSDLDAWADARRVSSTSEASTKALLSRPVQLKVRGATVAAASRSKPNRHWVLTTLETLSVDESLESDLYRTWRNSIMHCT
jgi:excisionase family DNA binding protein